MSAKDLPLTSRFGLPDSHTLAVSKANQGYATLDKLFSLKTAELIDIVKTSGLRGRDIRGADSVKQSGFAVVHMAHDHHHWRPRSGAFFLGNGLLQIAQNLFFVMRLAFTLFRTFHGLKAIIIGH